MNLPGEAYRVKRVQVQLIDPFGTPICMMDCEVPFEAVNNLPETFAANIPGSVNAALPYQIRVSTR